MVTNLPGAVLKKDKSHMEVTGYGFIYQ